MKKFTKFIPLGAALLPFVTFAASGQTLDSLIIVAKDILGTLIPLLMTVVVIVFLYGVVKFVTAAGDATKIATAKNYIIYGLIGIFVMVAFWGIIEIAANTIGIDTGGQIDVPTFEKLN